MNISDGLFNAILSLDAYNRGYNVGIENISDGIGNATVVIDSSELGATNINGDDIRNDSLIGFYGIAYTYNGVTVISYRGTDDMDEPANQRLDEDNGWGGGFGTVGTPQADMAFAFYKAVAEGLNVPNSTNVYLDAAISLTGHSMGGGLAGLVAANDNNHVEERAAA